MDNDGVFAGLWLKNVSNKLHCGSLITDKPDEKNSDDVDNTVNKM